MEDTTSTTQQLDAARRRHDFCKFLSLLVHKRKVEGIEDSSDDSVEDSASCDSLLDQRSDEELPVTASGATDYEDTDCDVCSVTSVIDSETNEAESNHEVDETLHDYNLFEPKIGETAARELIEEIPFGDSAPLYDAWLKECGYSDDYVLKEDEDSYSWSHTTVANFEDAQESTMHKKNNHHSELNSKKFDETLHPCLFETEVERNKVYDQWFLDLVTWERNRLMWLDEVGEIEGFDSSDLNEDRTFLVKVGDEETDGKVTSTIESNCKTSIMNDNDPDDVDYWEACYQLERLQQHKYLHELGLPNWFDDLLEGQNCAGVEVLESCAYNKGELIETKSNLEQVKIEVPHEVALVYQFTDRNLWRKYHSCFKKGKFDT